MCLQKHGIWVIFLEYQSSYQTTFLGQNLSLKIIHKETIFKSNSHKSPKAHSILVKKKLYLQQYFYCIIYMQQTCNKSAA